ncbi:quinone-dependent dihydroorotate dehydrogenase [Flavobacteriaceae bacterium]|jgi:dihydroorotate dehydrogenase|nr:quinone-dependent dihydroorotate dehydrogenase [Flavobacteriaceae bacterium]
MYKLLIKPFLFLFDPEWVHHTVFKSIKIANKIPGVSSLLRTAYVVKDKSLERKLFGLTFPNPVGLAAGFDKDAKLFQELSHFGFGFVEIGTLTPKPQDGNPKKRMFRLAEDEGLINRMGFNNEGVEAAVKRLKKNRGVLIGGNIGKNKITPNQEAVNDYIFCFNALFDFVDYFVVNVSSPNTPNLRALQDKEPLTHLLSTLKELNKKKQSPKPILLKIAPDLTEDQLKDIIEIVTSVKIDGVIASNTTLNRDGLQSSQKNEIGGLSGKPVKDRSTAVIRFLAENNNSAFPIIGVGGIHTPEDAIEKLKAGASLIQLYTGFVYEGPGVVKKINKSLLQLKD